MGSDGEVRLLALCSPGGPSCGASWARERSLTRCRARPAANTDRKAIDTNARRKGRRQCGLANGRPSFMPTENSDISRAISVTRSRITETSRESGYIRPRLMSWTQGSNRCGDILEFADSLADDFSCDGRLLLCSRLNYQYDLTAGNRIADQVR